MKKLLIFITLQFLVLLPAFADWFPALPMSVFWTIKDIKWVDIPAGSVITFYDWQNNLISTYTTEKSWQYGANTAFEKAISLNQFEGWLKIKISTWGNVYTITSSEIDDANSWTSCPSKSSIIFFSWVCRYNLNVNTVSVNTNTSSNTTWWSSGWWWGWNYTVNKTVLCTDTNLVCKLVPWSNNIYKFYKKDLVSCQWWNLWKECKISNLNITEDKKWTTDTIITPTNNKIDTINNIPKNKSIQNKKILQITWKLAPLSKDDKYKKLATMLSKWDKVEFIKKIEWDIILVKVIDSSKKTKIWLEWYMKISNNSLKIVKEDLENKESISDKKILQITWKLAPLSKDDKYKKLATMLSKWDKVEFIKKIEWDIILVKVIDSSKKTKIWLEWYMKLSNDSLKIKK